MWKKIGFNHVIILTLLLIGAIGVNGQEIPSIQMMLSPQLQQGLQVIQISNLDILDQQAALYLFDIEIYNVLEDWDNARMIFQIEKDNQIIASIESDPFVLTAPQPQPPPGSPAYVANNIDLLSTGIIPNSDILIDFNTRTFNPPDDDFEIDIARSGRLVRGIYFLKVILENPAWGPEEVMAVLRLTITNPSLILLQSPENLEVVHTEYPFFEYESDALDFIVYVYKKLNIHDDIETTLSGHPTLEFHTSLKRFSYHITDGDPLESGAQYYWYVKALVNTTNGLQEYQSEVWQFSIDTEVGGYSNVDIQQLLEPLLDARAEEIAEELSGYNLNTITVDGEVISLEEYYQLLNSEYQGVQVEIEDFILQ